MSSKIVHDKINLTEYHKFLITEAVSVAKKDHLDSKKEVDLFNKLHSDRKTSDSGKEVVENENIS